MWERGEASRIITSGKPAVTSSGLLRLTSTLLPFPARLTVLASLYVPVFFPYWERTLKAKTITYLFPSLGPRISYLAQKWCQGLCPMGGLLSEFVKCLKGGPRSIFVRNMVFLEKPVYPNLFIRKLGKLNSIFYYSIFYT